MTFTREQIEEILETAQEKCFRPDGDDTIIGYMDRAFNNGVRMMMKETIYQILMKEAGKKVTA